MPRDPPSEHSSTQFTVSRDMHVSNGNFTNVTNGTVNILNADGYAGALDKLTSHGALNALHSSTAVSRQNICTPGTRTFTLNHLHELGTCKHSDSPDVVWMHGPAGAGKSAVMRTLASRLAHDGLLLATFFFFRSDSQRNTSLSFIPTLALQAWDALPATRTQIFQNIQDNQNLFSRPAHLQSPLLLGDPLVAALSSLESQGSHVACSPLTIIIDGLDECTDIEGQTEIINAVVHLATTIHLRTDRRVKIFVASRPEYTIKSTFDDLASSNKIAVVSMDSEDARIHLFYDEQLDKIRKKFGLSPSWPSKEEIKWLTDKSSGQYSFASVSTRFMYGGDPVSRLKIMQGALKGDNLQPFEALDQLYATILTQLPQDMIRRTLILLRCCLHPMWKKSWNDILGHLLDLPTGYVRALAPYLSSLIMIKFEGHQLDLESYHASLADFLCDPLRSGKFSLYIDDGALSHTLQRGILASVPESDFNVHKMFSFVRLVESEFGQSWMILHPFPRDELALALKKVDPPSLTLLSSLLLFVFIRLAQKQCQGQHMYATSPALWYAIWAHVPRGIRLQWERRTQLYSDIDRDKLDCAFGLGGVLGACPPPSYTWFNTHWRTAFLYLDKRLPDLDSDPRGWNTCVSSTTEAYLNLVALRYHLQTSDRGRFWQRMLAGLTFVLSDDPPPKPTVRDMVKTHILRKGFGRSQVEYSSKSIRDQLHNGLVVLLSDDRIPLDPKALIAMYPLVREHWWYSRKLVPALAHLTAKHLNMPRLRYTPFFIYYQQKRELVNIDIMLEARCMALERNQTVAPLYRRQGSYRIVIVSPNELVMYIVCGLITLVWAYYM